MNQQLSFFNLIETPEEQAEMLIKQIRQKILCLYPKASENEIYEISLLAISKITQKLKSDERL